MEASEKVFGAEAPQTENPPRFTLLTGGKELEVADCSPSNSELKRAIGTKAMKQSGFPQAYMPGPPAWDILPNNPHLVRGMVYPH